MLDSAALHDPIAHDPIVREPIVLTPGYMDDERKLSWLASTIRRNGQYPLCISPQPSDASVGIDKLAMILAEEIEEQLEEAAVRGTEDR